MFQQIISIFLLIILAVCVIGLLVCFGALGIIWLSRYSAFFLKLYLYFFERGDYKLYQEAKMLLKETGFIPVCSSFTDTTKQKGIYFLVHDNSVSLWKDDKPFFVEPFHSFVINQLIKKANLSETILSVREADIEHKKQIDVLVKQLEKEIEEDKARLAKLNEQNNA